MDIRTCKETDIATVRHFVSLCKPLGVHTGYTYWMLFRFFGESCFVMEENGKAVGYISGMKSDTFPYVFFVWQIGVAQECRGKGYSYLLLEKAATAAKQLGCTALQFTIEPDNEASLGAFRGFAQKKNLKIHALETIHYPHSVRETIEEETIYEIAI